MAPKIDRKNLQKKKIKVGSPLKMEADVIGEPEPVITWTFGGQVLKVSEKRLVLRLLYIHLYDIKFLLR